MSLPPKEKIKISELNKNKSLIKIPKIKNPFNDPKTNRHIRESNWNNRFIYSKIPNYDSFKDKNVLCNKKYINFINYRKIDNYLSSKSPKNYLLNQTNIDTTNINQKYSNQLLFLNKTRIQTFSAKDKNYSFISKNYLSPLSNNNIDNNNQSLINLKKLWDELEILKPYRNYFNYIYKELETEYKEEIYQKEIQELNRVKLNIKSLKYYIGLRLEIIQEIKELNEKLGKELLNKNNNAKEILLNEISNKIILLREQTINVCQSMKKLKEIIFTINNLDKYDFDILSKKFKFDKNYLIKMKSELNFLKEGFSKYYFNIENDQTPFLLKASDKTKITKEDYFIRVIPLNNEIKNSIIDCIFYIHQELIAYQNIHFNKKDFRRISPIRRKDNEFISNANEALDKQTHRMCITDREKKNKLNGIENDKKAFTYIGNYTGDDKKSKNDLFEKSKNNNKINVNNNNSSNIHNNLMKNINENNKTLIEEDIYENLNQKKENYDKDQIIIDNVIGNEEKKNLNIINKNQTPITNEKKKENQNENNNINITKSNINKSPLNSFNDGNSKLNNNIIENQLLNNTK